MLGKKARKKAKKAKDKAKRAIHEVTRSDTERADTERVGYPPPATPRGQVAPAELPPSAMVPQVTAGPMREPDYPDDALAAQRMSKAARKGRSAIKKKTIKDMHALVNRRIAGVGAEQTVLNPDMSDHQKFVQLTRQTGNIGDTLAGQNPAPELVYNELIRVMALAAGWAQSIAPKRGRR
jgi:hypothetical protein